MQDTKTEKEIQSALETTAKGRTTLTIAHRLSTVMGCAEVVVLDHGKVIERGSPSDLLDSGGTFAQLWQEQQLESNASTEALRGVNGEAG